MATSSLDTAIERCAGGKIAVTGDFGVDAYWSLGEGAQEISVETGLAVRRVVSQRYEPGGAANVAANLVSLGVGEVRAVGVRGSDPFGVTLASLLDGLGIDLRGLRDAGSEWQTLVYAKPLRGAAEESRLDFGTRGQPPRQVVELFLEDLDDAASWADLVVVNQQVDGLFADLVLVEAINDVIAAHPRTTFVVDARDVGFAYRGAILKMNCREAGRLIEGESGPGVLSGDQVRVLAEKISDLIGKAVFITRGERGILAADGSSVHEARGIQVLGAVDTVGAGDTALAAIAAALASNQTVATAAELANLAASVVVTKLHTTGTVTPGELRKAAAAADLIYDPDLAENPARARYLDGSEIELVAPLPRDPRFSHAIFDHDGTLSTLRQGWEEVMFPMMVRAILGDQFAEVDAATHQRVRQDVADFIERSTGIQTLVQMKGLVEMVRRWGFVREDEISDEHGYKAVYNEALIALVDRRLAKLERGELDREDFHIKGALAVLRELRERGVTLYLASGTDHADVVEEATALGFAEFFGEHIYGATGDITVEAKRVVMDRILEEHGLSGTNLVTFGDGPVEMRETRRRGGVAVGLCSDEIRRFGFNPSKRARLVRGGANLLVADFTSLVELLPVLGFGPPFHAPERARGTRP